MRLAYAAELLPLDQRVCVVRRSITAGAALTELLQGVLVEPVVTDSDRVVLAPVRATTVGSVASSFGISYPRVYVDGIEVANSLLVTELDVESVERVEVFAGRRVRRSTAPTRSAVSSTS